MTNIEVDGCIKVVVIEFFNYIRANNAYLCRTMCYECCDIECAYPDEAHVFACGGKGQGSVLFVMKTRLWRNTSALHERKRFVEDTPFGHSEGQLSLIARCGDRRLITCH